MFIQVHTLRDYSASLPNRGADGLAKRMPYGGVVRQRISSQCLKAALGSNASLVRTSATGSVEPDTTADLGRRLGINLSTRSALIGERLLAPRLKKEVGLDDAVASVWADAVMALWRSGKSGTRQTKAKGRGKADATETEATTEAEAGAQPIVEAEAGAQPIVVGQLEINGLVTAVRAMSASKIDPNAIRDLFTSPLGLAATSLRERHLGMLNQNVALYTDKHHAINLSIVALCHRAHNICHAIKLLKDEIEPNIFDELQQIIFLDPERFRVIPGGPF
jgi:hypothetical protein